MFCEARIIRRMDMVEGEAGRGDTLNAFNQEPSLKYLNCTKMKRAGSHSVIAELNQAVGMVQCGLFKTVMIDMSHVTCEHRHPNGKMCLSSNCSIK